MIGIGFYYDRGIMMEATLTAIRDFFRQNIHGVRRFGTASLDLCQVGLGRYGAYFEYQLHPCILPQAALFVEEAGGVISDCELAELPMARTSCLASNGLFACRFVGDHQTVLEKRHAAFGKNGDSL